ncbi:universal stress protein [Photobacterium galatheae]|uniref:Universal stress protein n=1 Tax=Photobacterium galatheae TaxID=1654360 RepID=A0A066RNQ9_9GAMM|nr:universal stress protein [Photobacterium galatheae]KDM92090.1 universal stress protein [Photobacterium galatheae]MCM0150934.1 universal stress protein [Photobacterium galatheae]
MKLYKTVLLALNPDDQRAQQLVVKAGVVASHNHADLHLAYVEPGVGNLSFLDIELQLKEAHDDQELRRMAQLSELATHSPQPVRAMHLYDGDVAKHLIELAAKIHADLVIVGHAKTDLHWLREDVRRELDLHLKCDVLICR